MKTHMKIKNLKVWDGQVSRLLSAEEKELFKEIISKSKSGTPQHLCNNCDVNTFMSCPKVVSGNDKFPFIDSAFCYQKTVIEEVKGKSQEVDLDKSIILSCSRFKQSQRQPIRQNNSAEYQKTLGQR